MRGAADQIPRRADRRRRGERHDLGGRRRRCRHAHRSVIVPRGVELVVVAVGGREGELEGTLMPRVIVSGKV